jgi:hypothetical protein
MDGFDKEVCKRLPLSEAVLRLFDFVCQEQFLDNVFESHRGRSYEQEISFPMFVQLIADALLEHDGSGHKSFQRADENGELGTTIRAPYGKLARVPLSLSVGFLSDATARMYELYPLSVAGSEVPESVLCVAQIIDGRGAFLDQTRR